METYLETYSLNPRIVYILPVPDGEPEKATPLQGFAMSLCLNSRMMRAAASLPSNVFALCEIGQKTFAARRICGVDPVNVVAMSPRAIRSQYPPPSAPFNILLLPKDQRPQDYREWASACEVAPLIVAEPGGDISWAELSIEAIRTYCLEICNQLPAWVDAGDVMDAKEALTSWTEPKRRELGYKIKGHASVTPNLMALDALGFEDIGIEPFDDIARGPDPYVEQIVRTSETILAERRAIDTSGGSHEYPHFPDINLFSPAMYPHVAAMRAPDHLVGAEKRAFFTARDMLVQQTGYAYTATTDHQKEVMFGAKVEDLRTGKATPSPHPLMRIRQLELAVLTDAVGIFAASDLSATIRLPHAANTASKTVRSFAEGFRTDVTHSKRRLENFRQVQIAIGSAVPNAFLPIVRDSRDGVRIIADAHLEWLDIDGLPLSIRKNVSRLPVTPGNLLLGQMAPLPLIHLTPEDFSKVLIISALKRADPIRPMFEQAFEVFGKHWVDRLKIEVVEVASADQLVEVLNAFDGPLVIFDGHGSHRENHAGVLHLQDETCDIWQLQGRLHRPPPIVVLSACDTHAAARNHATVANGFLAIGSRAVLSSVFPLEARQAAIFAARLIFRVSDFIPAAIRLFDRALTWTEVVSGMLRMQLMTDFLRLLAREKLISEESYIEIHQLGNQAINGMSDTPFEDVLDLLEKAGVTKEVVRTRLELAIANSSVLAYLNIGRPETILIDSEERIRTSEQR